MTKPTRAHPAARTASTAALVIAVGVLGWLLLGAGSSYSIHADFTDASQLVVGGRVEVAGRKVGSISAIGLTRAGQADVTLSINDGSLIPLHRGTRAVIREPAQAGLANHEVELSPGPASAPAIPDGGTLPISDTASLVELDAILDSFGPAQRANLQQLIAHSAQIFAGSGARYFNGMLGALDPAVSQLAQTTTQLGSDGASIDEVIRTANVAAGAIASRNGQLTSAVAGTARSLGAVASEQQALADLLKRAPAVLAQADTTLAHAGTAVTALRPALRQIVPVTGPLRTFVRQIDSTLPPLTPVLASVRGQLPALRASLDGLVPLRSPAVNALDSAARALSGVTQIVRGGRIYGSDFILGVLNGLLGVASSNYSRAGHYLRLEFTQPYQTFLTGPLSQILSAHPLLPSVFAVRTGLDRRCPGGNAPPAIDGSSPWIPDPSLCTPSQDVSPLVNDPPGIGP